MVRDFFMLLPYQTHIPFFEVDIAAGIFPTDVVNISFYWLQLTIESTIPSFGWISGIVIHHLSPAVEHCELYKPVVVKAAKPENVVKSIAIGCKRRGNALISKVDSNSFACCIPASVYAHG